jgi:putative endonuclease
MTNRPNGILYLGVTAYLRHRVWQQREGLADGFTKRYALTRLVHAKPHASISAATQRERTMKHWPRTWKVRLILKGNPEWAELYDQLL